MILDIQYVPGAVLAADAALAYLTTEVAWLTHLRARQTASFGLPYEYSGQRYPACEMPPVIAAIAARAADLAAHPFNNCLCNRYETGANAMGFHADSYAGLVETSKIAIASFGASRRIVFRSTLSRQETSLLLEHGSILLMTQQTQAGWRHAIPRDPRAGCRISTTFRLIAAERMPRVVESTG